VLVAGQRDPRVKVMPAHGLSLEEVVYPPDDELAGRAREARATRTAPDDAPSSYAQGAEPPG
jgi:tRNA pseudouridine38-40 synthase